MHVRLTFVLASVCCLISAAPVTAALQWETTVQKFETHPLQVAQVSAFPFVNTGKEPVTITALKSTCGCVSGKVEPKRFAPGESGVVRVTFDLSKRLGPQRKAVKVITDADTGRPVQLFVATTICYRSN